jgi:AGCS family alanine or glycine:cation symporter
MSISSAIISATAGAPAGFYESIVGGVETFGNFLWGGNWNNTQIVPLTGPITYLLLGTGLYLMIGLKFMPIRQLPRAVRSIFAKRPDDEDGAISPFQALATALSGQVGTGNLAGVATALTIGGPGAIFWMWVTAMVGMASAYSESMLAVRYREHPKDGQSAVAGGPMYYIKHGLGKSWMWLAVLFAAGTVFSAVATGNMIQANSLTTGISDVLTEFQMPVPKWMIGAGLAVLVFIVIIGGIKSIGSVAGKIVPTMALAYVLFAIVTLIVNATEIPAAFMSIINGAFNGHSAAGGFLGATMAAGLRIGAERGLFSNEAGQGSAPIAHAAARTKDPIQQGKIAMVGTFMDTMIICTMTALVILTATGSFTHGDGGIADYAWQSDLQGIAVTTAAFDASFDFGRLFIVGILSLFVFTTILGWAYYGERAIAYLGGEKLVMPFRMFWVVMVFVGSLQEVDFIWRLGGIANAAMAAPNLIALLFLSFAIFRLTKEHDAKIKDGSLDVDYDASAHVDDGQAEDGDKPKD